MLCLGQLQRQQHSDDVCSAVGNNSTALFVEENGCLKERCCSVLRLIDALTIAVVCASVLTEKKWRGEMFSLVLHYCGV